MAHRLIYPQVFFTSSSTSSSYRCIRVVLRHRRLLASRAKRGPEEGRLVAEGCMRVIAQLAEEAARGRHAGELRRRAIQGRHEMDQFVARGGEGGGRSSRGAALGGGGRPTGG